MYLLETEVKNMVSSLKASNSLQLIELVFEWVFSEISLK